MAVNFLPHDNMGRIGLIKWDKLNKYNLESHDNPFPFMAQAGERRGETHHTKGNRTLTIKDKIEKEGAG